MSAVVLHFEWWEGVIIGEPGHDTSILHPPPIIRPLSLTTRCKNV